LPTKLGRAYGEWRRGRPGYDVGVFPVGTSVARTLRRSGLTIVDSPVHAADRWWARRAPAALANASAIARAWGAVRLAFLPTFVLAAKKPGFAGSETRTDVGDVSQNEINLPDTVPATES
jgi:hypothetical protein